MLIFRRYSYNKALRILSKAKRSTDIAVIKQLIMEFCDYMKLLIDNTNSYKDVFPFIRDDRFIFPGKHRELSVYKLETEVSSSGFLSQLLSILDIRNHLELSESLQDAIGDFHSDLSRGLIDVKASKNKIFDVLTKLRNTVYQTIISC